MSAVSVSAGRSVTIDSPEVRDRMRSVVKVPTESWDSTSMMPSGVWAHCGFSSWASAGRREAWSGFAEM